MPPLTTEIKTEELYYGPGHMTIGGVDVGARSEAAKLTLEITVSKFEPENAGGPIVGGSVVDKVIPKLEVMVSQINALKLAWAMPGATSVSSPGVGGPLAAGGLSAGLETDPAVGATNIRVDSVANAAVDDFVEIGPAAGKSEANSEIARIVTVGTIGAGGTGIDIKTNETGGGLLLDHPDTDNVREIRGTTLAADAVAGSDNVKVVAIPAGLAAGQFLRVGDAGEFETREIEAVGTAGAGGTGITFTAPLLANHDVGDWVVQVEGLGTTTITWTLGRIPSSAYRDVVVEAPGLDGRLARVTIQNASSEKNVELSFGREFKALPLELIGHYAQETPNVVPVSIELL